MFETIPGSPFFVTGIPNAIDLGDLNGDGILDLAVANGNGSVSVLLGNGFGGFGGAIAIPVSAAANDISLLDLNADGNLDFAVALNDRVSILLGDGAGGIAAATNFTVGMEISEIAIADFNNDGIADIVAANRSGVPNISVLVGDGAGNFTTASLSSGLTDANAIATGDFNRDGRLDIVTASSTSDRLSVLLSDAVSNTFNDPVFLPVEEPVDIAVADLNGDLNLDIITANGDRGNITVFLGNASGNFSFFSNFAVPDAPRTLSLSDVNGDGIFDVVTGNTNSTASILIGNGAGGFGVAESFGTIVNSRDLAVGDFNSDGLPDLTTVNAANGGVVSLLTNVGIPGILQFGSPEFSVVEGQQNLIVTVSRSGGSSGAVSATIALGDNTAIAPADYDSTPILVEFGDGDSDTKIIAIPIVDDAAVEGNETVNLALVNPTGGTTIGDRATATLTIVDNDISAEPPVNLNFNFDGIGDLTAIENTFLSQGIGFSNNAISLVEFGIDGRGNFQNPPTGNEVLTYATGDAIAIDFTDTIPVLGSGEISFAYTSPHVNHTIEVLDANNNVLTSVILPRTPLGTAGEFGNFISSSVNFAGNARSIRMGSLARQIGIDDLQFTLQPPGTSIDPDIVNNPPTDIVLSNNAIAENSDSNTLVGTLTTVDADIDDTHTYTLLDDSEGRFAIDGNRLIVAENAILDFETDPVQMVTVRTQDSNGATFIKTFTVVITDVPEGTPSLPPTDINLTNNTIPENSDNGAIVGGLFVTDPDVGDTHTLTLLDDADGRFTLDENRLVVANGMLLDFETNGSHAITVRATDSGGLTFDETFIITVEDVFESGSAPVAGDDTIFIDTVIGTVDNDAIVYGDASNASVATNDDTLLFNDFDPEGDTLAIAGVSNPVNGSVNRDSLSGNIVFSTSDNFPGTGSFEYTVADANGNIDTGLVTAIGSVSAIDGLEGDDTLILPGFVSVDLAATSDQTLGDTITVTNFENVLGSPEGDRLFGDNNNNRLFGEGGDDFIDGRLGSDTLDGGAGNDNIFASGANSSLSGGDGNDNLVASGGNSTLTGGAGNDSLVSGVDNLLLGGDGDDTLIASSGDETLFGGLGDDFLEGNGGSNVFAFNSSLEGVDEIGSFSIFEDRIFVSAVGFGGGLTPGVLGSNQFKMGTMATDADDRFIHEPFIGAGLLFFDPDGIGPAPQVPIAEISGVFIDSNNIIVF